MKTGNSPCFNCNNGYLNCYETCPFSPKREQNTAGNTMMYMTNGKRGHKMKSVLISIKPRWCELIASGKKTVEVRKTKPKLDTPFKVYIYQTRKPDMVTFSGTGRHISEYDKTLYYTKRSGKVIGEFVCDKIIRLNYSCGSYRCEGLNRLENDRIASASQLSLYDMRNYLSCNGGCAWHISDLVIYDKPKELREFHKPIMPTGLRYENDAITRPPQSWCYVEERSGQ